MTRISVGTAPDLTRPGPPALVGLMLPMSVAYVARMANQPAPAGGPRPLPVVCSSTRLPASAGLAASKLRQARAGPSQVQAAGPVGPGSAVDPHVRHGGPRRDQGP